MSRTPPEGPPPEGLPLEGLPSQAELTQAQRKPIIAESLAVGIATATYGASFGAVSVAAGLSIAQTCALSLLMFTGASQFALVGVIASGGAPLSGTFTALLLGTRNTLYGLRLGTLLQWRGLRRVAGAHLLIDESTAMGIGRDSTPAARLGFTVTGLTIFVGWNLATLAGAVAGEALGDPRTYGLDAAVGGAFLALLWPRLKDRRNQIVAVLAAALALGLVPLTAAGVPVLAAGGVALLVGVLSQGADPTELPSAPGHHDSPSSEGEH